MTSVAYVVFLVELVWYMMK